MKRFTLTWLMLVALLFAACEKFPTKEAFLAKETKALQAYCSNDVPKAETALLECLDYAKGCQQAGVKGIYYDEVFGRTYARLYLVARHLGHNQEAEQYLQNYAHFHAIASTYARLNNRPYGEMERMFEQKFDRGLQIAWKPQKETNGSGKSQ